MIENEGKIVRFICENCDADEECDLKVETFQNGVDRLKYYGWKIFKENEEWKHICKECR